MDDDYIIQPGDLGGADEPENDPGVVEEAIASGGEPKQPISPCFEKVPFKNRKIYRKIYDGFEFKDMSFEDFCVEMYYLHSPAMMRKDLAGVIEKKHQGNRQMAANLHDINKHLN